VPSRVLRALALLAVGLSSVSEAQTPTQLLRTRPDPNANAAIAVNNPWFGAQLAYRVTGDAPTTQNFQAAGQVLYHPLGTGGKFQLPVMANLSEIASGIDLTDPDLDEVKLRVQELLYSTQGISAGLYPLYEVVRSPTALVTLHGAAALKLNGFTDSTSAGRTISVLRLSAGVDLVVGSDLRRRSPLSLSITPVWTRVAEADLEALGVGDGEWLSSIEVSGVLPLRDGFGLIAEWLGSKDERSSLRVGVVLLAEMN
jgi:hypothetical protein